MRRAALLLLLTLLAPTSAAPTDRWQSTLVRGASAQSPPAPPAAPPSDPAAEAPSEREIVAAISRKEYRKALELIDRALVVTPDDPLLHYNAACALCLWGRIDDAAERLRLAVDKGFRDFLHMERDPDLDGLRGHPTYRRILEGRDAAGRSAALREVQRWRERFGEERYRYEFDEALNLHFATALGEQMHRRMIRMLQAQGEEQVRSLFAGPPREAVFVAIPTRQDATEFFADLARRDRTFSQPGVAGIYEHRPRRLVSVDTGASLRHEFTHALHYGDMERLGQSHPLWIQEGLATLYEDYDYTEDDAIVFLPNERDNTIRELLRHGEALPWRALLSLEAKEFMRRPQELYPQVRSMFRYLAARRKLTDWYRAYTRDFGIDRSGARAFEQVFGMPLAEIERNWKEWALGGGVRLPAERISQRIREGRPALPERRPQQGSTGATGSMPEGPATPGGHPTAADAPLRTLIGVSLERRGDLEVVRVQPGSSAAQAGVRIGDALLSLDGVATQSVGDAVAALVRRKPGDSVELVIRRGREYLRLPVTIHGTDATAPTAAPAPGSPSGSQPAAAPGSSPTSP